ncbi:MAG: FAD:protein FMN transferase [Proteobacteria bacterium]|nr:FAD:protein FMN transferase [Pseudomonadota bacterium]
MPGKNMKKMDRREFLRLSGMLGLGAATVSLLPVSESLAFDRELTKVTRTREAMGTLVAITVMSPSAAQADDAIGLAFAEMDRVAALLDRFQSASAIGALNADGKVDGLPDEVVDVLAQSRQYYLMSGGAFDITVQPVVDLFRDHFSRFGTPPPEKDLEKAVALVSGQGVLVEGRSARLALPGMGVTLDGIAKGYVIDAGARALEKAGVAHGLVNAGGDIRAIGGKGGGRGWTVAVRNPNGGRYVDEIRMTHGAVATSGDYEVYFDREKLYHHIVTPWTGRSPITASSVTVRAETVTRADALSTAVFVMGPKDGLYFTDRTPDAECLVVDRFSGTHRSKGWNAV